MEAVFVDGLPAKITIHDFRRHHLQSFPTLVGLEYDNLIAGAIGTVYEMFPGVVEMWDMHRNRQIWYEKTTLCYRLLTAWLIQEYYPEFGKGGGGDPLLKQKKIDGVSVTFNTERFKNSDPLSFLHSNTFGRHAFMMIQTAPRRALLRVTRFV